MAQMHYNRDGSAPISAASTEYAVLEPVIIQQPVFHIEEAHEQVSKPVFTTVDAHEVVEKPVFKIKEVLQHVEKPVFDLIDLEYKRLASDIEHIRLNIPHLPSVIHIERVPQWVWPVIVLLFSAAVAGWIR